MWTPERLSNGEPGAWSAGWPIMGITPDLQVGGMGGARAAFIVYPERQLAVVVLTNLVGANPQEFIAPIAAFYGRPPSPQAAARTGMPTTDASRPSTKRTATP
jgi:CubicO group peptidase (beta-lactamase class C family)